jgi:diguanylate cyclase (GGDEF)-like protein
LFDEYGRDISSIFILVNMGHVYLQERDLEKAEQILMQALEGSINMEMRNEQARCHHYLSQLYEQRGVFDKALDHYKKFQMLRENISGETALKELAALRVSHQIEAAQRDVEIHRLQKEKLETELEQHKRLHTMLEELATRDPLTNLYNRRHFLGLAEREWRRSKRYQHPLCALMIDVDDFKQINDRYGHATGDNALIAFADVIQSRLRSTELAGRYGGDEFMILLTETQPKNGVLVAKRICQSILDYPIRTESGLVTLTPSIGVAAVSDENRDTVKSLNELLNRADKALYAAKKLGRGQVQFYTETA